MRNPRTKCFTEAGGHIERKSTVPVGGSDSQVLIYFSQLLAENIPHIRESRAFPSLMRVTEVWIKGLLYSNKVKNKWFFIHLGADNNHSFTLPQLVLIKTSRSIETHTECELACVTVCVSPHHSGVQDISAGTLFFRSHSGKTSSPHPTLILPGSHTNTQWCSGAVRTLQQPAALSFMNIHIAGQSSGSFH